MPRNDEKPRRISITAAEIGQVIADLRKSAKSLSGTMKAMEKKGIDSVEIDGQKMATDGREWLSKLARKCQSGFEAEERKLLAKKKQESTAEKK